MQQVSSLSGLYESYEPFLGKLIATVRQHSPETLIVWQMTWAYSPGCTHSGFVEYNNSHAEMYSAILDATAKVSRSVDMIIPSGVLIENLREGRFGAVVEPTRDGYHLDTGLPSLAVGCLWHEMLVTPHTSVSCIPDSLGWIKSIVIP